MSSPQLAVEAWNAIREISHDPAALAETRAVMAETGLAVGPAKALKRLPLDEPMPMRQLAAKLRCDNSYVTALADALEEKGLARRETHPTDRRIKVIVLSDLGRKLARRLQAADATPPVAFAALSPAELETLCGLLSKLDPTGA